MTAGTHSGPAHLRGRRTLRSPAMNSYPRLLLPNACHAYGRTTMGLDDPLRFDRSASSAGFGAHVDSAADICLSAEVVRDGAALRLEFRLGAWGGVAAPGYSLRCPPLAV